MSYRTRQSEEDSTDDDSFKLTTTRRRPRQIIESDESDDEDVEMAKAMAEENGKLMNAQATENKEVELAKATDDEEEEEEVYSSARSSISRSFIEASFEIDEGNTSAPRQNLFDDSWGSSPEVSNTSDGKGHTRTLVVRATVASPIPGPILKNSCEDGEGEQDEGGDGAETTHEVSGELQLEGFQDEDQVDPLSQHQPRKSLEQQNVHEPISTEKAQFEKKLPVPFAFTSTPKFGGQPNPLKSFRDQINELNLTAIQEVQDSTGKIHKAESLIGSSGGEESFGASLDKKETHIGATKRIQNDITSDSAQKGVSSPEVEPQFPPHHSDGRDTVRKQRIGQGLPYSGSDREVPGSSQKTMNGYGSSNSNVESLIEEGLRNITISGGSKMFSFKKKGTEAKTSREPAGTTCRNFFDDESEEDDDSLSANFDLDSSPNSSDIQVIDVEPEFEKTTQHYACAPPTQTTSRGSPDLEVLAEKINKIQLGRKAPEQPRKAIFLNEPPPIERKTYAYDPLNARHQEFYGDVQRTVTKLAETISMMPAPDEDIEEELPRGLVTLYDHQKYGLRWLSWREGEFPGGGILADEMGLGKTIMIIALIMKSKAEWQQNENWIDTREVARLIPAKTTLVVCPVGCLLQWEEEIKSKGRALRVSIYHGTQRTTSAAVLAQNDVVLTTYSTLGHEILKDSRSPLRRIYFRRVVLDEAHSIRNPKTKSAMAVYEIAARHRWAVTGTPVHNRPEDFFSMIKFLRMVPFDEPKVWDFWIGLKQVRKSKEAQQRLQTIGKALILRRTKEEVQSVGGNVRKIPPKSIEIVQVELNQAEKRVYDHLMRFSVELFKNFLVNKEQRERDLGRAASVYAHRKERKEAPPDDINFSHLFALITRLRQCAVLPYLIENMLEHEQVDSDSSFDEDNDDHLVSKRNPVFERLYQSSKIKRLLEDLIKIKETAKAEGKPMDKVVIVSCWTSSLKIIHEHLRTLKISSRFLTGEENADERLEVMKLFNNADSGRPQVVLLSLCAGGVGINLTGGNHVFFLEPHWNPQLELQAQDRVHRFGQTKDVFIRRYICTGTIEDRIFELQKIKLDLADGVLSSSKQSGGGLSLAQMRVLFQL